jgi:AAA domain
VFKKASKSQSKLRLALIGIAGSGKTFTALRIAKGLGARVALIDTERGSASKYAGDVADFDVLELDSFAPATYVRAIQAAGEAGYDVLVIDSLTHAWTGKGGAIEMVDRVQKRSGNTNSFVAWREVTPEHNAMVEAILQSPCHVIATIRAKTAYDMEENERGRKVPKKIGMKPEQRDGLEYEFDVVADIDSDHNLIVGKTRCADLDGEVFPRAGEDVAIRLKRWLTDGTPYVDPKEALALEVSTLVGQIDDCVDPTTLLGLREQANALRTRMDTFQRKRMHEAVERGTERVARLAQDRLEAEEAERVLSERAHAH